MTTTSASAGRFAVGALDSEGDAEVDEDVERHRRVVSRRGCKLQQQFVFKYSVR